MPAHLTTSLCIGVPTWGLFGRAIDFRIYVTQYWCVLSHSPVPQTASSTYYFAQIQITLIMVGPPRVLPTMDMTMIYIWYCCVFYCARFWSISFRVAKRRQLAL